jgi:hypothetical protein
MDPGEPVPAGECDNCGMLVHECEKPDTETKHTPDSLGNLLSEVNEACRIQHDGIIAAFPNPPDDMVDIVDGLACSSNKLEEAKTIATDMAKEIARLKADKAELVACLKDTAGELEITLQSEFATRSNPEPEKHNENCKAARALISKHSKP